MSCEQCTHVRWTPLPPEAAWNGTRDPGLLNVRQFLLQGFASTCAPRSQRRTVVPVPHIEMKGNGTAHTSATPAAHGRRTEKRPPVLAPRCDDRFPSIIATAGPSIIPLTLIPTAEDDLADNQVDWNVRRQEHDPFQRFHPTPPSVPWHSDNLTQFRSDNPTISADRLFPFQVVQVI